jgi:hypothetical protein
MIPSPSANVLTDAIFYHEPSRPDECVMGSRVTRDHAVELILPCRALD